MVKHHLTKYWDNGIQYAESWLQINLFGKPFCFSKRKITL